MIGVVLRKSNLVLCRCFVFEKVVISAKTAQM